MSNIFFWAKDLIPNTMEFFPSSFGIHFFTHQKAKPTGSAVDNKMYGRLKKILSEVYTEKNMLIS